jgi:uncharacterized protein YgiM (DUF1202 family)
VSGRASYCSRTANPFLVSLRIGGAVLEKPQLIIEAKGDEIIVRTLGFYATYHKSIDPPQLVLRPPSSDDAKWVALTSVNLRERPTRSAPAIGVVAKGTKLHLISRKRSWVRVTNPATSEKGWIYGRHVAGASVR